MSISSLDVGKARTGFSLASSERAVANAEFRGIAVSAVIALLTIVLGAAIWRRITASLRKLASGAEAYGAGRTHIDLPDDQSDEAGFAARASRKMIADREKAEASIVNSEKRLRDIAVKIEDVVWINSPDFSQTLYVNPAFERVFSLTLQDLQNDPASWAKSLQPKEVKKLPETIGEVSSKIAAGNHAQIARHMYARSVAMQNTQGVAAGGYHLMKPVCRTDLLSAVQNTLKGCAECFFRHLAFQWQCELRRI